MSEANNPAIRTAQLPDRLEKTITLSDAIGGADPSDLDNESLAAFVGVEKDMAEREMLKELARDRLDEDDLPEAAHLLWVDQAEVYPLCSACYEQQKHGAWTGSTNHPHFEELMQTMNERLENGTACAQCKRDTIDGMIDTFAEMVDVDVTVDGWDPEEQRPTDDYAAGDSQDQDHAESEGGDR